MVLGIVDSNRNMKRYDFYSLSSGAVKLPVEGRGWTFSWFRYRIGSGEVLRQKKVALPSEGASGKV